MSLIAKRVIKGCVLLTSAESTSLRAKTLRLLALQHAVASAAVQALSYLRLKQLFGVRVKLFFRVVIASINIVFTSLCWAQTTVPVVEYFNAQLAAYFITGRQNEQVLLDNAASGFKRTGATFQAVAADTATADLERVCRFYISIPAPNYTSSHFYGRASIDCSPILAARPLGFSFDGYDFAVKNPIDSNCPVSHPIKIYRALRSWTALATSNHRYSTSAASHARAVASGWRDEGVAFCVTGATDVDTAPSPINSATGVWGGTTNSNRNVFGIVPPDGQAWIMYTDLNGDNSLAGAVQGTVSWSGPNWSLTNARDFSLEARTFFTVLGNGPFSARATLGGTLSYPTLGQVTTFTTSYSSAYEIAPNISAIAGTYSGRSASFAAFENASFTIAANGSASGRGAGGCNFVATVNPYAGANLYTIRLTFQGGVCLAGTATFTGVVYYDEASRNLYALILDSARTAPFFFIGAR